MDSIRLTSAVLRTSTAKVAIGYRGYGVTKTNEPGYGSLLQYTKADRYCTAMRRIGWSYIYRGGHINMLVIYKLDRFTYRSCLELAVRTKTY